ncbi:MAG TPA: hypothetical protein VK691_10275 [Solirubrobacteraceae bacterium]|jgi:hypothetical protein|nr:hypothetical protein [Solirubrobacteraceae bacterium]
MANTIRGLLSTNPQELVDELEKLREQEKRIAHERELVERVLEIVIESGGPSAEYLTDPERGLLTVGPLRAQVMRVYAAAGEGAGFQPREVHEQLVAHGNSKVTLDNVRVTMGRMADSGELLQPEPPIALYLLPPSTPESGEADDV